MNFSPKNWYWTQWLCVLCFIGFYIMLSLTPWYYLEVNINSIETEQEDMTLRQSLIYDLHSSNLPEGTHIIYANEGRPSSVDTLLTISIMSSFLYVFGLLLSKTSNLIWCIAPSYIGLLIKFMEFYLQKGTYSVNYRYMIYWVLGIFIYTGVYLLHNKMIITEIE